MVLVFISAVSLSWAQGQWTDEVKASVQTTPRVYEFTSRFDANSSVGYPGQVIRQVLIADLMTYTHSLERGTYEGDPIDAFYSLWSYVEFSQSNVFGVDGAVSGDSHFSVKVVDLNGSPMKTGANSVEISKYRDITSSKKDLLGKLAGTDPKDRKVELRGWNETNFMGIDLLSLDVDEKGDSYVEVDDFIWAMMQVIGENASEGDSFQVSNGTSSVETIDAAYITEEGLDLNQLINKVLIGALSFSQASADYLRSDRAGEGIKADNTQPKSGKNYTALEHHWDEAFGYFGAARDYLSYADSDIWNRQKKIKPSIDTNGDSLIDLGSEKNFGVSVNAAKIDIASASGSVDFTNDIFKALITGRHLIVERPRGYEAAIVDLANSAIANWEKVIAATVIHYINFTVNEMNEYGQVDASGKPKYSFASHAKFWSEMKAYALAFQFNPNSAVTSAQFDSIHRLMRNRPVLMTSSLTETHQYKIDLISARDQLGTIFGFATADIENW